MRNNCIFTITNIRKQNLCLFLKKIVIGISVTRDKSQYGTVSREKKRKMQVWGVERVFYSLSTHLSTFHRDAVTHGTSRTCPELVFSHSFFMTNPGRHYGFSLPRGAEEEVSGRTRTQTFLNKKSTGEAGAQQPSAGNALPNATGNIT